MNATIGQFPPNYVFTAQPQGVVSPQRTIGLGSPIDTTNTLTGQGKGDFFTSSSTAGAPVNYYSATPNVAAVKPDSTALGNGAQLPLDLSALLNNPNTQAVNATNASPSYLYSKPTAPSGGGAPSVPTNYGYPLNPSLTGAVSGETLSAWPTTDTASGATNYTTTSTALPAPFKAATTGADFNQVS